MKNFKLSRLFAAAVLVACLAFTGCKPVEDATQAIIKTQVLTQNTYATLLSGNWRSQYNDGYTIGGGLMIYDDGGYGFGWTRFIVEYADNYIYTVDADGKYYAVHYNEYSGITCKFANAYKSGGLTFANSLLQAKIEFTEANGYFGVHGTYVKQ